MTRGSRLRPVLLALVLVAAPLDAQQPAPAPEVGSLPLGLVTDRWVGDFDGMVGRRRLRILTPYSRSHYFVDKGVQRGMVFDFGTRIEHEINRTLKTAPATRVHVVFVPTARDQLYRALIDGHGDLVATNLTVGAGAADVDFTTPGNTNAAKILVTGPSAAVVHTRDDLSGREVAVREESAEVEALARVNAEFRTRGRPAVRVRTLPATLEDEDLLEMVSAGMLDATIIDDGLGRFWAAILSDLRLHPDIVVQSGVSIAWAVRKNSPRLLAALNPIIAANRIGSTFGNVTLQTHLKRAAGLGRATSQAELAKFRELVDVFRRYAEQYELDYLLMMAMGYQESRLNPNARSERGAVGLMQVMPATGRDLGVGDIRSVEGNVHAGVKYIRLIIDQHVGREPTDPLNRMLFAFAGYNCGPARLRQLRREAARQGLNPNVWFDHVERAAGAIVGRETVDYVSGIYKYYIAYTLALGRG